MATDMQERIKKMAVEAGLVPQNGNFFSALVDWGDGVTVEELEKFAQGVARE